jgi:hypothetical protein
MEAIRSSETLVLIRAARRDIPEDGILDRDEIVPMNNVKYYTIGGM